MTRRAPRALAGLLALAAVAVVRADRLHLDGGGTIDTAEWWIEGPTLVYRSANGTIGIPRAIVLKIEPTAIESEPASDAAEPAPAPPAATPPPAGVAELVPAAIAALLEQARAALERGDFTSAADLYGAALERADPDLQLPRVGYALSRIALGDDEVALGVVLDGLARDPRQPALLELLGDLRNRAERVEDAVRAWRSAFDREPSDRLRQKIEKAERELAVGRNFDLATTSHFNLRFDGEVDEELSAAVVQHLEERFWVVAEELEHTPRQPITVLLYPKRQFRDATAAPEWVGGLYDGKIRVPLGGLRRLDPVATGVLTHELTHAIVHSKTRGNCPRWLHEGLAQRFEGRAPTPADRELVAEQLAAGDAAEWESRGFSYPAALSLSLYLVERGGFHRVVDLLEELGQGLAPDAALGRVYGIDYATLCREWKESVLDG